MRTTLVLAISFSLAACSGKGDDGTDPGSPDATPPPPPIPDAGDYIHDPGLEGAPFSLDDPACVDGPNKITCSEITYSVVDEPDPGTTLELMLYLPSVARTTRVPVIVYIHGGGWLSGDYHDPGLTLDDYLAAGYAVADVEYRLTTYHGDPDMPTGITFPQNLQDVKTAVRWFRTKGSGFIDPDRILIYGFSAGAHLASLMATTADVPAFDGRGDPSVPTSVRAAVGLSTPIDFHMFVPENPPLAETCPPQDPPGPGGTPAIGVSLLIGGDFADPANSAKLDEVSALTYIGASSAPLQLFAGTCDQVVPYAGAAELVDVGTARGATVSEHLTDGAEHGQTLSTPEARQILNDFLTAQLAP